MSAPEITVRILDAEAVRQAIIDTADACTDWIRAATVVAPFDVHVDALRQLGLRIDEALDLADPVDES